MRSHEAVFTSQRYFHDVKDTNRTGELCFHYAVFTSSECLQSQV